MAERLRIVVHGRVQGVFFRAHAMEKARSLGLVGWVRNAPEGTVEIMAEGEREKLQTLLMWCSVGSPAANVQRIEETWGNATGEFKEFGIRW
ncbi:MAG: acylphosphatase [Candidatus Micrarchaeota archaeon]|nr:acylphosphatase [Candidatus Micrarchaeota archaeon]